jgi:hypothetical protein
MAEAIALDLLPRTDYNGAQLGRENAVNSERTLRGSECTRRDRRRGFILNDSSYSANAGKPTPIRDWWEGKHPTSFGEWDWDMARYVIDRHSRGINVALVGRGGSRAIDGSANRVRGQRARE